ncbi:hypothetical protein [Streptomyces sp. AcE210]|uniref:hypothetical protein n=1 Tax=Streptomyces sp. AcE210 TaxID=2292703 RepID=UPI001F0CA657|nr:hypothetical protein [Streptomyces sp. AcE210]
MTNASTDRAQAPTRRSALAGLAAGAGAAVVSAASAASASPAPAFVTGRGAGASAPTPAPAASPTPGAMQLFTDPGLNFNALLALGGAGFGAAEVGEVLTSAAPSTPPGRTSRPTPRSSAAGATG